MRTKGHSALFECVQEKIISHEKHTVMILHDVFSQLSATPGLGKIVRNCKCSGGVDWRKAHKAKRNMVEVICIEDPGGIQPLGRWVFTLVIEVKS